jgi:murein DD-endopeptidase MepM/ murein hydrolase activator NlpD
MDEKSAHPSALQSESQTIESTQKETPPNHSVRGWSSLWTNIQHNGWGEMALRVGSALVCLVLVVSIIWVMRSFYLKGKMVEPAAAMDVSAAQVNQNSGALVLPAYTGSSPQSGIARTNDLHTYKPDQSRFELQKYTVLAGDSLFVIAQKFNLNPQTILFGNYDVLYDNPDDLKAGQVLNILPVDGALYVWNKGDGLNKVSQIMGVKPEDIINWPGNHLNPDTIGDYSNPNIAVGTKLFIPGGKREFISWNTSGIRRDNPAVASVWGAGACGKQYTGPIGQEQWKWPATMQCLSGYDFSPATNHPGVDIKGHLGDPVYAAEAGVVVYSGDNGLGYGVLVIIDHGNGYQSLYAHLMDPPKVGCGAPVHRGDVIGWVGMTGNTTGPHLHFQLMLNGSPQNPNKIYFPIPSC